MMKKGGNGFTIVPNALLLEDSLCWLCGNNKMEAKHRMVLLTLLAHDFHGDWFKAGMESLKSATGFGRTTIWSIIKELESALLVKVRRNYNCVSEYNLDGFYERFLEEDRLGREVSNTEMESAIKEAVEFPPISPEIAAIEEAAARRRRDRQVPQSPPE